jgi:hypothetical protein
MFVTKSSATKIILIRKLYILSYPMVITCKASVQVSMSTVYKLHKLLRTAPIVLSAASHDGYKQ